jgi:hypothetical protein
MDRLLLGLTLFATVLGSAACRKVGPATAELNDGAKCGKGTVLDLELRTAHTAVDPIYIVTFRLNDTAYTAEAAGGRIALFGPFVENARVDFCVSGGALTLTTPSDDEPEVLSYPMNIVRTSRVIDVDPAS